MSAARGPGITTAYQNSHQVNMAASDSAQQIGLDLALRIPAGGQVAANPDVAGTSAMAWIMAFAALIFLLWLLNKTRIGHAILYYLLALAVASLILMNYRWLAGILAPLTSRSISA